MPVYAAQSLSHVPFGRFLLCRSFLPVQNPTGPSVSNSWIHLTGRLFSVEENELARARMPTEAKIYTGLFKWRDIVRWHKTWHVWLCEFDLCQL